MRFKNIKEGDVIYSSLTNKFEIVKDVNWGRDVFTTLDNNIYNFDGYKMINYDVNKYHEESDASVAYPIENLNNFEKNADIKFNSSFCFKILKKDYNEVEEILKDNKIDFFSEHIPFYDNFMIIVPYLKVNPKNFNINNYFLIIESVYNLLGNFCDRANLKYLKNYEYKIPKKIYESFDVYHNYFINYILKNINMKNVYHFLNKLSNVNEFNPESIKEKLLKIMRFSKYYNSKNPNNINPFFNNLDFGREGSEVIYFNVFTDNPVEALFINKFKDYFKLSNSDEFDINVNKSGKYVEFKIRNWWD